jgi:AraC-like DNA-binding protein
MFSASIGIVRAQWSFQVALACQRFAGAVLEPEPDQLVRAVDTLARDLPVPESQTERFMLRDRLRIATENAAHQFHAQFHRYIPHRCDGGRIAVRRSISWDNFDLNSSRLLVEWASGYLEEFVRSHEWPAPMRAAHVIRSSFEQPLDTWRIARTVGCARGGLIRSFKGAYGMSMGDYQARCRIRAAFGMVREPDSNVGAAAFQVGYRSTKNFYRALREHTGLTPSQVRRLTDDAANEILKTRLHLPAPTFSWA